MIEHIWNVITKGTRLNPYKYEEFPEYHCEGLDESEKERLKAAWYAHPEFWGNPDSDDEDELQPNWDALFDIAGIELMNQPDLEFIRSLHESFLADLEGLAVEAIASNNWDAFYAHVVNFQNEHCLYEEIRMSQQPTEQAQFELAVFMTQAEANELTDLLEWKNDPQFRPLIQRIQELITAAKSITHAPAAVVVPLDKTINQD